ncbi:mitochondrial outer membrane translocase complex, subunit Tom20 domain-containing protein [Spinellus fusiger]|nr:mitochondrial outer membrane translocase complex, subunit Tom20 domain-containing protein [Spinellus fusiger]
MPLSPHKITLTAVATLAAIGIGYGVYFDYSRRSDPDFRKRLRRERRLASKATKESEEKSQLKKMALVEHVIVAASKETYPVSLEDKEQYFITKIAEGEALCEKGEAFYLEAVLPFYMALKVYPAPMELITIYQKSVPGPVFENIVNIFAIEQQVTASVNGGLETETVEIEVEAEIDN